MKSLGKHFSKVNWIPIAIAVLISGILFLWKHQYLFELKKEIISNRATRNKQANEILPAPDEILGKDILAKTTIYYAEKDNKPYLKVVLQLNSGKARYYFIDNKTRTDINIYSDNAIIVKNINISNNTWHKILEEPIEDSDSINYIQISDHIYSFKQAPNSKNLVFVTYRVRESDYKSSVLNKDERTIYYYDVSKSQIKKILTLSSRDDTKAYTYPIVDSWSDPFSKDGRYVSFNVFGCEGCGPGQPEKLLIDLSSSKVINIGRVSFFGWKENGEYEYKDYVAIRCGENEPNTGCSKNPSLLPLKTGKL